MPLDNCGWVSLTNLLDLFSSSGIVNIIRIVTMCNGTDGGLLDAAAGRWVEVKERLDKARFL